MIQLRFYFFFLKKAKNLGRSDDAKWRKNRGWPNTYIFFQIDRLEPSFTDSVSVCGVSVSVSVSVIPFPDSGFRIPCFSAADEI